MNLGNLKITESDYDGKDIESLPDTIAGNAAVVKKRFDAISKEVITPKFNSLIDELENLAASVMLTMNPVGTIKITDNNINPGTYIGGTWEQIKDRFLLGAGDVYAGGSIGGEAAHTLTENELPEIAGNIGFHYSDTSTNVASVDGAFSATKTGSKYRNGGTEGSGATSVGAIKMSFGGGAAHNNMPPYVACYIWKRIA